MSLDEALAAARAVDVKSPADARATQASRYPDDLAPTEVKVLQLLMAGRSTKQIAEGKSSRGGLSNRGEFGTRRRVVARTVAAAWAKPSKGNFMRTIHLLLRAAACLLLIGGVVAGGSADAAPVHMQPASPSIEPGAGAWTTWLLTSGAELRLPPPPDATDTQSEVVELRQLAEQRDGAALDRISYWDASVPSYRWTQRAVEHTQSRGVLGNRAIRMLALLNVAIYDATIAAWDTKYAYNRPRPSDGNPGLAAITTPASPSYPDEHAVAAGAASTVLTSIYPSDAEMFRAWADEAARSRLEAGVAHPSDVSAGLDLGRQVGVRAVARGRADGSDAAWSGGVPTEPGKWKGTNPVEPLAGTWATWTLGDPSQFRPGPPPALDSEQMARELADVKNYPRTNITNLIASFWEYYGGRGVFEFWNDQASRAIFDHHLHDNPPRAAQMYAASNIALHDSMVACWDAKYTYWAPRPAMVDPSITTVFATPNHPSYPSAHSCLSGAAAGVLGEFFPADAARLNAIANQSGDARVMGGIHFKTDCDVGLALGRQVAGMVLSHANLGSAQASPSAGRP
jgi:membrane-associated phospholipid phosphatase